MSSRSGPEGSVSWRGISQILKDEAESDVTTDGSVPPVDPPGRKTSKTGKTWVVPALRVAMASCVLAALAAIPYVLQRFFGQDSWGHNPLPEVEVTDDFLHEMLAGADKQYKVNVKARSILKKGQVFPSAEILVQELKEDYLIPLYPCALEGRFGNWGLGGKWVCLRYHGMARPPLVISVGGKGDVSFERDVTGRLNAFSHKFEYTLNSTGQEQMQSYHFLKFYPMGVWGTGQKDYYKKLFPKANFVTLKGMMREVGASFVDILKLDCEGCEHMVVEDMKAFYTRGNVPFGQIVMDLHWLGKTSVQLATLQTMDTLGYRMFHTEVDPSWADGFMVSFIHQRLVDPKL